MADFWPTSISFVAFLLLSIGVGIYSGSSKQQSQQEDTTEDYILASRDVNPWTIALSTVATGNSGFMFIGLIGYAYQVGISSIWIMVGWITGDYLAWMWVHRRLRKFSEEKDVETIPSFLAHTPKGDLRWITAISALAILIFLGAYAAAQLQAGSKALSVVFGWDYNVGSILGAAIVVIYAFTGGAQASIRAGAIQGGVMVFSMIVLLVASITASGGIGTLWSQLTDIDPMLMQPTPPNLQFGFVPFLIGWLMAGFGVVGQPHIMIRTMAIDSEDSIEQARNIYVVVYALFAIAAVGVGLTTRVLMPELMAGGDTELALPQLAMQLLPGVLVGLILAGLFSATISTADAQLLSCSAALTQDLFPKAAGSYTFVRIGTLLVTLVILGIALVGSDNVFTLVTFSWSALAASIGPLMIVRVLQLPISTPVGVAMMVAGTGTALFWRVGLNLSDAIYEALPGIVAGGLVYAVAWLWQKTRSQART
jgi:sodium/proline symporter